LSDALPLEPSFRAFGITMKCRIIVSGIPIPSRAKRSMENFASGNFIDEMPSTGFRSVEFRSLV
jgi:hypothetical protein